MKRTLSLLLVLFLLCGCSPRQQVYQITWLDVFDTVTTLRGYSVSEKEFTETAARIHDSLLEYHRLFDIYHTYDGINNLASVNENAGSPVKVDPKILDLLTDCKAYYALTGGLVNPAMGSVLNLWHQAREAGLNDPENAFLPDPEALAQAGKHCSFDSVILDRENQAVCLSDPLQRLDVGAVAKGWTAQRISAMLPSGYLLNLGGNTCASGPKPDASPWIIGIQDPDGVQDYLATLSLSSGSAVTSGDYQRTYSVGGKQYHHIIDPATRMPGGEFRSVTVVCSDSGLADCLSTGLFLMDLETGMAFAQQMGAEALWIQADGTMVSTPNFPEGRS